MEKYILVMNREDPQGCQWSDCVMAQVSFTFKGHHTDKLLFLQDASCNKSLKTLKDKRNIHHIVFSYRK